MNSSVGINTRRPGQLVLRGDPPELVRALGKLYGRHAATLTLEERRDASKRLIELANEVDTRHKKTILKLRTETVATAW